MLGEYARSLKYEDNAKYQVQIDQENRNGITLVLVSDAVILLIRMICAWIWEAGAMNRSDFF